MNFEMTAKFIEEFEGCKLEAYQDIRGIWTIGIGSTGANIVWPGRVITRQLAEQYLESRIADIYSHFMHPPVSLPQEIINSNNQMCALTSLIYNIGEHAFETSTILKLIHESAPLTEIANNFHKWVFAGNKASIDLIKRREKEAQLFLS